MDTQVRELVARWAAAEEANDTARTAECLAEEFVGVGVLEQQTSFAGQDNSGRFRLTLLAVARDEEWLVASVHLGPLQIPRQP